jgi:hypothetical protein
MPHSQFVRRCAVVAVLGVIAPLGTTNFTAASAGLPTSAAVKGSDSGNAGLADIDRRFGKAGHRPTAAQQRAAKGLGKNIEVAWSATGTASSVRAARGALTKASNDSADSVARKFLRSQPELFGLRPAQVAGLRLTMKDTDARTGATFLRYQQVAGGHDVFGATALVSLDSKGRVLIAGGNLVPDAGAAPAAKLTAETAVALASASVAPHETTRPGERLGQKDGKQRFANTVAVRDFESGRAVEADLVTVGTANGARTAWRIRAERASNADYVVLVDAGTGEVLFRENQVTHDGPEGTVFPGDDPEDGGRGVVPFGANWVDAGGETTAGNNTNTYQDAEGDNSADGDGSDQPQAADQHFNYAWNDPWGASPDGDEADLPLSGPDRDAVVTQLFYYTNWYHDYAYGLGFNEAARNFQNDNFGNGGSGGDAVEAESDANFTGEQCDDDGTAVKCLNNANFNANGPDGTKPRMQMYVGDTNPGGAARRTQRANNRDTVIHEYTHGISGRIISDGNLAGGIQSKSLGEGWSDAFATSINEDPVYGEYNNGDYTNGIRGVAYDDDSLEYGDFTGTSEHNNGRIWAMNMWETRAALIAKYGYATGKDKHERLMMLGLKNTVDTPSFHDARTGYLVADSLQNPTATPGVGGNWCRIWFVFADNELGVTAGPDPDSANAGSLTVSTDTPDECDPGASIAPVPDSPEGSDITFDGTGSTVGGDAGDTLSYAWDLDNDGAFDDSTLASPTWAYGDNAARTVRLRVTNSSGYTDTTSVSFNTTNVAPSVAIDLSDLAGMEENDTRTVDATFSDPGWQDTYDGNVDLGTSYRPDVEPTLAVTTQGAKGLGDTGGATPDLGTATAEVTYGDNGTYTVTVEITDDDNGTGSDDDDASVANVNPTAVIDTGGEQVYDGVSAFILEAGEDLTVPAGSEDPGSDDLTFTWDWDGILNGETPDVQTSLVDPPGTDPALSPSIEPRDVDLEATHAYADACLYNLDVNVTDDDLGSATDSAVVLITGNADVSKGHGWWLNQHRAKSSNDFTPAQLQCYLDIVNYLSMVFSEETTANTRASATEVLNAPAKAPEEVIFDQHALGAWLNFANGSVKLDTMVDTDGDGIDDATFGEVMFTAETVRLNPASTSAQVKAQKDIIERIATQSAP